MPENIWMPDLSITNMTNWETVNFTHTVLGEYQVRIWADKSFFSDVVGKEFNIEYTPIITFQVYHEFFMNNYPIDKQEIKIRVDSWMSIENRGHVVPQKLRDAASTYGVDMQ